MSNQKPGLLGDEKRPAEKTRIEFESARLSKSRSSASNAGQKVVPSFSSFVGCMPPILHANVQPKAISRSREIRESHRARFCLSGLYSERSTKGSILAILHRDRETERQRDRETERVLIVYLSKSQAGSDATEIDI